MAWSTDIDTIIETARKIERTYFFEAQNGYMAVEEDDFESFAAAKDGWTKSVTEGAPPVSTLRCKLAMSDFGAFEEFTHTNPIQKFAACRLKCVIYKNTRTAGIGALTLTEGSRVVIGNATQFVTQGVTKGTVLLVGATRLVVREVTNNLLLELYQVSPDTVAFPGVPFNIVDDEREYIFRGTIEDGQEIDLSLVIEAFDPLHKLMYSICVLDLESTRLGPYTDVQLRWASEFDVGTGGQYTYEIDPTAPGQAWAENIFGTNRAFVPAAVEVVDDSVAHPPGAPVSPSEYMVDAPYGLIRFHNDQTGLGLTFYINEIYVYQEGTLTLADIVEAALIYPPECTGDPADPGLGPGFTSAQLQIPLTGTFTFTNGGLNVNGAGCAFDTELSAGDRIAHNATSDVKGVVDVVVGPNAVTLRYPYKGATAGPLAGFKSTLRDANISVSNLRWWKCDGTVADLIRHLRDYYADSRGWRIWYDPRNDYVMGDQVEIDTANAISLGPKGRLRVTSSAENFASAIAVSGTIGRAQNYSTDPGVTFTAIAQFQPGWNWFGPSNDPQPPWGGMSWPTAEPPPAIDALYDTDLNYAYMIACTDNPGAPGFGTDPDELWFDLVHIDFGAPVDLSSIYLYVPNCKNPDKNQYGISIHKSDIAMGDLGPLTPECYHRDVNPDGILSVDCETAGQVQYILIKMRPIKWVKDGGARTMGLREIIIFGSTKMCQIACIQSVICPGRLQLMAGTVTFNAGGPPYMVTGVGTNFGGPVGTTPQVGDSICLNAAPLLFGYIEQIISPTSLRLVLPYPGAPGANGAFSRGQWPSLDTDPANCVEGQGGHFIGGSALDVDFFIDYYPKLIAKMRHTTHRTMQDDSGAVFTEAQGLDRAYIMLLEKIRMYREILWRGAFDPRFFLYDTAYCIDEYRQTGNENLYFLVEAITISDKQTVISGREYGAGVLE